MKRTIFIALLACLPAAAQAAQKTKSPLAVGRDLTLGIDVIRSFGALPAGASGAPGADWSRTSILGRLRGGLGDSSSATILGAQVGVEYSLSLGWTEEMIEPGVERPPLYLAGTFGPSMRVWTFDLPAPGMFVVLFGADGSIGGGYWWSNAPRLSLFAGGRFALGTPEGPSLELEYSLLPYTLGASFDDRRVIHTEHRFALRFGVGPVGVAANAAVFDDLVTEGGALYQKGARTQSFAVGVALEWRR